jgi:hypothetical protein
MDNNTKIKYLYMVLFWSIPKSGYDVIKKNSIMDILKNLMINSSDDDSHFEEKIKMFESENEGLVVYHEIIESDSIVLDPEIEIMPLIKERYPGAKLIKIQHMSAEDTPLI